jgi:superfamily I DNA/RNA helicase
MTAPTDQQAAAIHDPSRKVVIAAAPGSGKTFTLAHRCRQVFDEDSKVPGRRALAVTFTVAAANELRERAPDAEAGTFHGLCVRLRRMYDSRPFTVLGELDSRDIACMVGEELGILKPGGYKDRRRASRKVLADGAGSTRYRATLRRARAVDYEMLVDDAVRSGGYAEQAGLGGAFANHHVLGDEFQDTDGRQMELMRKLKPWAVTLVGDVAQSIYGFRNADPALLLGAWANAPDNGWSPHHLGINFRSVPDVVSLGNRIAGGMPFEAPPMTAHREAVGQLPAVTWQAFETPEQEAANVAMVAAMAAEGWKGGKPAMFVLGRSWRSLEATRGALESAGVDHVWLKGRNDVWTSDVARPLIRAMQLLVNPWLDHWTRLLAMKFGRLSPLDIARAAERAAMEDVPLVETPGWTPWREGTRHQLVECKASVASHHLAASMRRGDEAHLTRHPYGELSSAMQAWERDAEDPRVPAFLDWLSTRQLGDDAPEAPIWLSSVHGVKGLEAPEVCVVGLDEKGFGGGGEIRRLFFVAATRARDRLYLTRSTQRGRGTERRHQRASPSNLWEGP